MAFINLEEAQPKKNGTYKVIVKSMDDAHYETNAHWVEGKGFTLKDGLLKSDDYITSWWSDDNVR